VAVFFLPENTCPKNAKLGAEKKTFCGNYRFKIRQLSRTFKDQTYFLGHSRSWKIKEKIHNFAGGMGNLHFTQLPPCAFSHLLLVTPIIFRSVLNVCC